MNIKRLRTVALILFTALILSPIPIALMQPDPFSQSVTFNTSNLILGIMFGTIINIPAAILSLVFFMIGLSASPASINKASRLLKASCAVSVTGIGFLIWYGVAVG